MASRGFNGLPSFSQVIFKGESPSLTAQVTCTRAPAWILSGKLNGSILGGTANYRKHESLFHIATIVVVAGKSRVERRRNFGEIGGGGNVLGERFFSRKNERTIAYVTFRCGRKCDIYILEFFIQDCRLTAYNFPKDARGNNTKLICSATQLCQSAEGFRIHVAIYIRFLPFDVLSTRKKKKISRSVAHKEFQHFARSDSLGGRSREHISYTLPACFARRDRSVKVMHLKLLLIQERLLK